MAAYSHGNNDPRFREVEGAVAATLRFPGDRIAQFVASFMGGEIDMYRVIGSEGEIALEPGYRFEHTMKLRLTRGGKVEEKLYPKTDHFSGMIHYFSECIQNGRRPVADGEEGLNDMRVLLAIEAAAKSGQPQKIVSPQRSVHPTPDMARLFPPVEKRLML